MKQVISCALLGLVMSGVSFAEQASVTPAAQLSGASATELARYDALSAFRKEVAAQPSLVLQLVENAVRVSSDYCCDIVKSAIEATNADINLVGSILEVVALTKPEHLRNSALYAIAVAPDALEVVNAVLAKFSSALGDPLDFPLGGKNNFVKNVTVNFSPNSPGGNSGWGIGIVGNPTAVAAGTNGNGTTKISPL